MVSEYILVRLLDLSSHPLLGRYQTTLTYKFHARVEESQRKEGVLEILHQLEMRHFNIL